MKNQELKSSLIKSGIFLAICIFFIYSFAVSDSGGVTGTIGSLFSGVVFIFGLAFALIVSIAVMIGIYFGILAMYNQEVCKTSYEQFKTTLLASTGSFTRSFSSKCCSSTESSQDLYEKDIVALRENQNTLNNQISQIQSKFNTIEQDISTLSSSINGVADEINNLDSKTKSVEEELENKASMAAVDESLKKITGDINSIQNSVKPIADKLTKLENSISSLAKEEESEDVQVIVDKAITSLKKELTAVKASVESIASATQQEETEEQKDADHRILAYFPSKEDQEQFISLVTEAVEKEMTYAEIGELLNESLSPENAEIIADHPSLTKDFIRTCRQKD